MAAHDILLGPILGYEWDDTASQAYYTVIVRTTKGATAPVWQVDGQNVTMTGLQTLHDGTRVWRGEVPLAPFTEPKGRTVNYTVRRTDTALKNVCGDARWSFHLPGVATPRQQPRIGFCSCNGFTDPNALRDMNPLALWERMATKHQTAPLSLLLMGGDQLYCDDLARKEGSFARFWTWLDPKDRTKTKPTREEFKKSYLDHYLLAWARIQHEGKDHPHTAMVRMMASVPSVMMWDDHDIFDGWGSYQNAETKQPYYKEAFDAARDAFELYQIRGGKANRSLLDRDHSGAPRHYSQAVHFGPFHILVMDNRSHRTPNQIMDNNQWSQILKWLGREDNEQPSGKKDRRTLLVVSPVPVVYRRFQDWVSSMPGEHSGEDDLRDHWSHHSHEGERDRLVYHLFNVLSQGGNTRKYSRVTLLSGDVHVGALGFLERTDNGAEIAQVISSAIIHPAPTPMAWLGLLAISSDADHGIQGQPVTARMARPVGAKDRYQRCRNYAWLQEGDDQKLWVNWECEKGDRDDPERVHFPLK